MIRPNDLDLFDIVPEIGISAAQRAQVPDYIDRFIDSTSKPSLIFKSSRNPEVARLPRIIIDHGGRNNFNAWGTLRTICRNFGLRFKFRMGKFLILNFTIVFLVFTFVLIYNLLQLQEAYKGLVLNPAYRLPVIHPFVLQCLLAAGALNIGVLAVVFASTKANSAYQRHTATLLQRLQLNEAQRCFMADMIPKKVRNDKSLMPVITERLQYLSNVTQSIGIVMKSIHFVDANVSIRVFGAVASVSIISLLITYNGLWFSVFSGLYTNLKKFPVQFTELFINSDCAELAKKELEMYEGYFSY